MCFRVRLRLGRWHRYMWLRVRPCLDIGIIFDSCKTLSGIVASI
ncbi:hypothetical protein F383_13361 [Gossypium arboreum]|uniref:Uncharacterized protein n=1 Tax=Gossypium arboreum TaxID=29729 RepID=A0A0B0NFW5_GOSAR|nr:hypothetical protein F383_13361 [Gossypium arboreum]